MAEALVSAARSGSVEACTALLAVPAVRQELNRPDPSGNTALHVAVWRNHCGLVEALLGAGADPNVPDRESGWTPLHSALYWGNIRAAVELLQAGASLALTDWQGRTPLDLVSAELKGYLTAGGPGQQSDAFSFGNGSNYTLGTGSTDVQPNPCRVEGLHGLRPVALAASKFHSLAITADGQLYSHGWGLGGRLGHPEAHIHSGESAVIVPRLIAGLGRHAVTAVAAAKHHSLLLTTAGDVLAMGSNRHGQLGFPSGDTSPTPRRVAALRLRAIAVAAGNKHSAAVAASGELFTWGCNALGQLGYGTSDSGVNPAPRLVEAMRGKRVVGAAAAKRHSVALTAEGDVYTWGHRGVSPRRVQLAGARDMAALSGEPLRFHRGHADVARPTATAVCAGAAHSCALTPTGVVLAWRSADPALLVQEVGGLLAGRRVVSVSAGKYRTAAVTDEGDVFMWEGRSDYFPADGRQPGSGSSKKGGGTPGAGGPRPRGIPISGTSFSERGCAEVAGGSFGCSLEQHPHGGSYGSLGRPGRGGSFFERMGREREGPSCLGPSSSSKGAVDTPRSAGRAAPDDGFAPILPCRVEGLKRVVAVAVGEKHSLALQSWSAAQLEGLPPVPWLRQAGGCRVDGHEALASPRDDSLLSPRDGSDSALSSPERSSSGPGRRHAPGSPAGVGVGPPPLQALAEARVAAALADPRTAAALLEYADVAGAAALRAHCLALAACALDAVLGEGLAGLAALPAHLLADLERLWKLRLAGAAGGNDAGQSGDGSGSGDEGAAAAPSHEAHGCHTLQPGRRPTAAAPWLGTDGPEAELGRKRQASWANLPMLATQGQSSFQDQGVAARAEAAQRLARALAKKLQQIAHLEERAAGGSALDPQQRSKVGQRPVFASALAALEGGAAAEDVQAILRLAPQGEGTALSSKAPAGGKPAQQQQQGPGGGGSAAKPPKAKASAGGRAAPEAGAAQQEAALPPRVPTPEPIQREAPAALAGSSPPPGSLVPPFGAACAAASAAADYPSLVGFADPTQLLPQAAAAGRGPRASASGSAGKSRSQRKGGLSLFLRGGLDSAGAAAALSPSPQPGGSSDGAPPAWGARPVSPTPSTSLRDILGQEAGRKAGSGGRKAPPRPAGGEAPPAAAAVRVPLSSFLSAGANPAAEPKAAAWSGAAAGASPPGPQLSLRAIQEQQELLQQGAASGRSWGASPQPSQRPPAPHPAQTMWRPLPGAPLLGSSPSAAGGILGTSPSGRAFTAAPAPQQSRWYVPEEHQAARGRPKSLRAIQAEESAVAELGRLYGAGNVRVLAPEPGRRPGLPPAGAARPQQ